MSFSCKDCEHAIITEVNCRYYGHTHATVDCECKKHISKEERIRADERDKILSIVSRCIAYNVYNVSEGIALLNEIKEELKEQKNE